MFRNVLASIAPVILLLGLTADVQPTAPHMPFMALANPDCGHCHECTEPGVGAGHEFHEQSPYTKDKNGSGDHPCFGDIPCDNRTHPACGSGGSSDDNADLTVDQVRQLTENQAVLSLAKRVAINETAATSKILAQFGHRVILDRVRGVIQIGLPCSRDFIVAQVPLTAAQLTELNAMADGIEAQTSRRN